jgi:hypothetical protein
VDTVIRLKETKKQEFQTKSIKRKQNEQKVGKSMNPICPHILLKILPNVRLKYAAGFLT